MSKLFTLLGATIGGWLSWYAGAMVSITLAFLLSIIGTGVGMYIGRRLASHYS